MKILILCSDNSCLSQMAQGWLQSFDKSLTVCSAGISPAIEVHPLAVQTLASSGIDISHHKPEAVEEYIDEPWDYVITVSRDAEENSCFHRKSTQPDTQQFLQPGTCERHA